MNLTQRPLFSEYNYVTIVNRREDEWVQNFYIFCQEVMSL